MFRNRKDAAEKLATALIVYKDDNPLVLAIPRGGVEVGYYVAKELGADFSVLISRKLGFPEYQEAAFGAIAEDKSLYLYPMAQQRLSKEIIEGVIRKEEIEIKRRIQKYRSGKPLPSVKDRNVILVDDGIATGSTLLSAVKLCQTHKANRIIVAAPVAGKSVYTQFGNKVDDLIILETPVDFFAVSQAYEDFHNATDADVIGFMRKYDELIKTL